MINIIVCDDNKIQLTNTLKQIEQTFFTQEYRLFAFTEKESLFHHFESQLPNRIVILDIDFGIQNESGIDLARQILEIDHESQIIFLTAYLHFAVDVDEIKHVYFLVKPIYQIKLLSALQKACNNLTTQFIEFKLRGEVRPVLQSQIVVIERELHNTNIHLIDDSFSVRQKLEKIHDLLDKQYFFQCHKSFLCNWKHVVSFRTKSLVLSNGFEVPISRSYYPYVKNHYTDFIGGQL